MPVHVQPASLIISCFGFSSARQISLPLRAMTRKKENRPASVFPVFFAVRREGALIKSSYLLIGPVKASRKRERQFQVPTIFEVRLYRAVRLGRGLRVELSLVARWYHPPTEVLIYFKE
jgi:hypothetical protein